MNTILLLLSHFLRRKKKYIQYRQTKQVAFSLCIPNTYNPPIYSDSTHHSTVESIGKLWKFWIVHCMENILYQRSHQVKPTKSNCYTPHSRSVQADLPTQESLCSSNPAEHTHLPMGTSHSPSALQYILGVSLSSAWSTHWPLTSTNEDESAPVTTSVKTARLRLTPTQRLQYTRTEVRAMQAPMS